MDINLKDVQQWYASKINKQVGELDSYDFFCAKVAYDYACESGNKGIGLLPPVEQHLLDEAVEDIVTISTLNEYSVAKKLINEQFVVINKQDLANSD
jgi:hypothetical protein